MQTQPLRRAEALKDYLVKERGIDPGRIEAASAGESQPISDNDTAEGRKANRRGEEGRLNVGQDLWRDALE